MPKRLAFATALTLLSGCTTEALLPAGPAGQTVGYPQTRLAAAPVAVASVPIEPSALPTRAPAAPQTTGSISASAPYDEAADPIFKAAMAPPASQAFEETLERKADGTIRLPPPAQIPVIDTSGTYAALAAGRDTGPEDASGATAGQ